MKIELPFQDSILNDMAGKTMILAENHRNEPFFRPVKELHITFAGECQKGWRFEVSDGTLKLLRDEKPVCLFNGLETRKDVVYMVGYWTNEESRHGFDRVTMYEKRLLTTDACGVCVSSHAGYEKDAIPVLLQSLKKAKFDSSKVLIVVGGDPRNEGKEETRDGIRVVRTGSDAMGFVAVPEAGKTEGPEYWLLVHDTCEFEKDFVEKLATVEVGLSPDIVLLMPADRKNEMGFYSAKFLKSVSVSVAEVMPGLLFPMFMNKASIVMTLKDGKTEVMGDKDVYGTGNVRKIVRMPAAGIRKFVGKSARGGRP
jgi:hypothetical protein